MAHVTKYETTFYSLLGDKIEVRIKVDGYAGAVLPLPLMGANPVLIETRSKDGIIYGTGCTIQVKSETMLQYNAIVIAPENTVLVEVDVNDVRQFNGYMNPELYEEAYNKNLFRGVTLRASCGLSALENKYLVFETLDSKKLIQWVIDCLGAVGIAYDSIVISNDLVADLDTYNTDYTLFSYNSATTDVFMEDGAPINCKEILKRILGPFGIIVNEGVYWYIQRHRDRRDSTTGERRRVTYQFGYVLGIGYTQAVPVHTLARDVKLVETGQALQIESGKKIVAANLNQVNYDNLVRPSGIISATDIPNGMYDDSIPAYDWIKTDQITLTAEDAAIHWDTELQYQADGISTRFKVFIVLDNEGKPPLLRLSIKAKSSELLGVNSNKYISMGFVLRCMTSTAENYYYHDNSDNRQLKRILVQNVQDNLVPYSTVSQIYDGVNKPDIDGYFVFDLDYDFGTMGDYGGHYLSNGPQEFQLTIKTLHYRQGEPVENIDHAIGDPNVTPCIMGDFAPTGYFKELEVTTEIKDLDNYFEAESVEGYRDKEEFDLFLHDAGNTMIASALRNNAGGQTTVWKQKGVGDGETLTKWFLHDKFQQFYKPRYTMECTIKKAGRLPFFDMIDEPLFNKLFYIEGRQWNLKTGHHRLKLHEYIDTDPGLDDL